MSGANHNAHVYDVTSHGIIIVSDDTSVATTVWRITHIGDNNTKTIMIVNYCDVGHIRGFSHLFYRWFRCSAMTHAVRTRTITIKTTLIIIIWFLIIIGFIDIIIIVSSKSFSFLWNNILTMPGLMEIISKS